MKNRHGMIATGLLLVCQSAAWTACGSDDSDDEAGGGAGVTQAELESRAYIVSKDSSELTIIDLKELKIAGRIDTRGVGNHMAELTSDFRQSVVTSPETNEAIVVDNVTQKVVTSIPLTGHPTHLSLSRNGKLIAIVEEDDNAVSFIDPSQNKETHRIEGFQKPHFVRWAPDGDYAYVANIDAHYLTKVDIKDFEIVDTIALDGFDPDGEDGAMAPEESGFADAQIDKDGILKAADIDTGRVIVYDTKKQLKLPELKVGPRPWIVYAEHPFSEVPVSVVPNWGDQTVTTISPSFGLDTIKDAADQDSNGVNYTSLAPNKAFVMNRLREDIAVIDTSNGEVTDHIDVGGNTETASTTPDGKWIVATVSSANAVVVIDALTNEIVKRFDNVGKYPWSVTVPKGQNYCH